MSSTDSRHPDPRHPDPRQHQINYVEFPARDLVIARSFYRTVFGWEFQDYGDTYVAFSGAGVEGGFFQSETRSHTDLGAVLIVLYSSDLESTQRQVEAAGGIIIKPVFSFPGGRRFHFEDPNGNELAVWSEIVTEED